MVSLIQSPLYKISLLTWAYFAAFTTMGKLRLAHTIPRNTKSKIHKDPGLRLIPFDLLFIKKIRYEDHSLFREGGTSG
jgi:hypothetical protein